VTNTDRVQMLEALLERVRRNRNAPRAAAPVTTGTGTPPMPPVVLHAPIASAPSVAVTPPAPPVAATPPSPPVASARPPEPPPAPAAWQPEPGSAVQPRPGTMPPPSLPPEEVSDDDLLEVTTIPPDAVEEVEAEPAVAAAPDPTLAGLPVLEPPVLEHDTMEVSEITAVGVRVSGATLDALAGAAQLENEALEAEREVPIKTPPPESGPQEALPPTGLEAARTPDVDQLEADLISPPSMGPTAEQLGETIELEAPRGPELEIDVTVEEPAASVEPAPAEELEVALPRPSMQSGLYDMPTTPPAEPPPPAAAAAPVEVPATDSPQRTARPALGATDVAQVTLAPSSSPKTFVELLDASLLV